MSFSSSYHSCIGHNTTDELPPISIEVAIKTAEDETALVEEAKIMALVRGHDHVIHLQGIMLKEGRVHLVISLCTNQNLRQYLSENRDAMMAEVEDGKKLRWAKQVTRTTPGGANANMLRESSPSCRSPMA